MSSHLDISSVIFYFDYFRIHLESIFFSTSHFVKVNFVGIYLIIITDKSTTEVLYLGQHLFLITPLLNFLVLHFNHCKHWLWVYVFEQVSTSTTWICLYNIHLVFQSIINITIKISWIFIIAALDTPIQYYHHSY